MIVSDVVRKIATLIIAAFLASPVWGDAGEHRRLVGSLGAMGYGSIKLFGCVISFSRTVTPTEENNHYFRYSRVIRLDTLEDIENSTVEVIGFGEGKYFAFKVELNDEYADWELKIHSFSRWSRKKFPGSSWPHIHPSQYNEDTPRIEAELRYRMPSISRMNTWTDYSSFGKVTRAFPTFEMNFDQEAPLREFKSALFGYSNANNCTNLEGEEV